MGIVDRLRNINLFGRTTKTTGEMPSKTAIATGGGFTFSWDGLLDRTYDRSRLKDYWKVYSGEGTVFASVNLTAWNICMTGYTLESEDKTALRKVEEFINNFDFDTFNYDNTVFALVLGNSYAELIKNRGGGYQRLKQTDPFSIDFETKQKDKMEIDHYYKIINDKKAPNSKIPPDTIVHYGFFPIAGDRHYMSILEPSWDMIKRKVDADDAICHSLKKYGLGEKYHIKLNTDGGEKMPTLDELQTISKDFEDLSYKNEIVTPDVVDISVLEGRNTSNEIEAYFDFFLAQLTIGLICPQEVLGLGSGSTEATASIRAKLYERQIKSYQHRLAHLLQTQVFDRITGKPGAVKIHFKGTTDEDEALKAEWISRILTGLRDACNAYEFEKPLTPNDMRAIIKDLLTQLLPSNSNVLKRLSEDVEYNEVPHE